MEYKNLKLISEKFQLILGSGSPRRVSLLCELEISFEQLIPSIDESIDSTETPVNYALRMAQEKALKASDLYLSSRKNSDKTALFVGCDTIVRSENRILGKPKDKEEALSILKYLSGKRHIVTTAIALFSSDKNECSGSENTTVFFNEVSSEMLANYVESGEPMDKAGAYGIQGMGAFLVDRIEGNLDNVIGLPRMLFEDLAGQFLNGINVRK